MMKHKRTAVDRRVPMIFVKNVFSCMTICFRPRTRLIYQLSLLKPRGYENYEKTKRIFLLHKRFIQSHIIARMFFMRDKTENRVQVHPHKDHLNNGFILWLQGLENFECNSIEYSAPIFQNSFIKNKVRTKEAGPAFYKCRAREKLLS